MPEFLKLIPPAEALEIFLRAIPDPRPVTEFIDTPDALGRITSEPIVAPHPLPAFSRSAMDGYAVRAEETFGASENLPVYLELAGEVLMGTEALTIVGKGQALLIHTGGMLPEGADAVVALEYTQQARDGEIEILCPVAVGENVLNVGEDVRAGEIVIPGGSRIGPAEIGGLMGLGIVRLRVAINAKTGIISTGNEITTPDSNPSPGQVRDINSYSLTALVQEAGGEAIRYGIVPDEIDALKEMARKAHQECDLLVITAGSSASARDMTAEVIRSLGEPGVLVHGIGIKPGKPTILGVCDGKPVIGLPGNPVSALVISRLFVVPAIHHLLGLKSTSINPSVSAALTANIPSRAGREDWVPVKLQETTRGYIAEPIFSKSNLIFSLVNADGLVCIPSDATGLSSGETAIVHLL